MSLLGTPVYANPSQPLWVSVNGSHTGPITGRPITALDLSGNSSLLLLGTNPSNSFIQTTGTINFGQIGQGNVNTSLTVSPAGSNTDQLLVGGQVVVPYSGALVALDMSGNTALRMTGTNTSNVSAIQTNDAILFTQVGQSGGNSSLQVKALGSNDILTIGGFCDANAFGTTSVNQPASTAGTGTLSNGLAQINTTGSDVTAQIFVQRTAINASTALGMLRVSSQNASNFIVTSAQPGAPTTTESNDQSSFAWWILNGT